MSMVRFRVVPSCRARPLAPTWHSVEGADCAPPPTRAVLAQQSYCYTRTSRDRNVPQPVHCASTRACFEWGGTLLFARGLLLWSPTDTLAGRAVLKCLVSATYEEVSSSVTSCSTPTTL